MNPIVINLEDVIQACRENFDQIQALQKGSYSGCSYSGPCMLGMPLTEEQRRYLDNDVPRYMDIDSAIGTLLTEKIVVSDHPEALRMLQRVHDEMAGSSISRDLRVRILGGLLEHDWGHNLPLSILEEPAHNCLLSLVAAHILASRSPA